MGPFPSARGNSHILVLVDYVSKWLEAIASPTNDLRVVAKLFKNMLISDNGAYFIEKNVKALLNKYGVHYKYGLGYHP